MLHFCLVKYIFYFISMFSYIIYSIDPKLQEAYFFLTRWPATSSFFPRSSFPNLPAKSILSAALAIPPAFSPDPPFSFSHTHPLSFPAVSATFCTISAESP